MIVLLEESEDIREDLLVILLSALGRNKNVSILYIYKIMKMLCCFSTVGSIISLWSLYCCVCSVSLGENSFSGTCNGRILQGGLQ